jgi:hypothetical protein
MIMLTPTNAAAVVVTLSYVYLLRFIVRLFFGNLSVNAIVFLTHIATLIDSINHITSLCASLIFIFFSVFILSSIFFVFRSYPIFFVYYFDEYPHIYVYDYAYDYDYGYVFIHVFLDVFSNVDVLL